MYGFQDSNDVGPGKSGGKFGLNTGVFVTKFEFNPNAGAEGRAGEAIDFTVQVGEKEYRKRFFPISKVFGKGDVGELTDKNSEEYKTQYHKDMQMLNATLTDIVLCFVSEENLKEALSVPVNNFKDFAEILQRLVQNSFNWQKTPVDIFLSYQWKPGVDKDRTYLEIPKDVKHGTYIVKTEGTGFEPVPTGGIKYSTPEGVFHTFKRSEWYKESPFANQTILENSSNMAGETGNLDWASS